MKTLAWTAIVFAYCFGWWVCPWPMALVTVGSLVVLGVTLATGFVDDSEM